MFAKIKQRDRRPCHLTLRCWRCEPIKPVHLLVSVSEHQGLHVQTMAVQELRRFQQDYKSHLTAFEGFVSFRWECEQSIYLFIYLSVNSISRDRDFVDISFLRASTWMLAIVPSRLAERARTWEGKVGDRSDRRRIIQSSDPRNEERETICLLRRRRGC